MSIRVGIYDLFAYTIPGAFYLIVGCYLADLLGLLKLDVSRLASLSTAEIVAASMFAYIAGLTCDRLSRPWYRFLKGKDLSEAALRACATQRPELEPLLRRYEWPVLLAHLRSQNSDISDNIDRMNVTQIMLRNVSLSLLLLGITHFLHC